MSESTQELFKLQAEICRTLADPNRLWILHELMKGEMSVGQLVSNLGLPQSNVSHHLAVLRQKSIVFTRREGTTIYYHLADDRIAAACDLVREVLRGSLIQRHRVANLLGQSEEVP